MTTETRTTGQNAPAQTTGSRNVPAIFLHRIETSPSAVALRHKVGGRWQDVTWAEYGTAVREIARGLAALGIEPGDRVGLVSSTRIEWVFTDIGILSARAVTVPVYPTSTPQDTTFVVSHSGAKVIFVEDAATAARVRSAPDRVPPSVPLVFLTGSPEGDNTLAFEDLRARGRAQASGEDPLAQATRELGPDDLATLVYTSGTTGEPKGAMLTHGNMLGECVGLSEVLELNEGDTTLSFLPLAHIFARMIHVLGIHSGYTTAYAESMEKVRDNIAEVHPSFMGSVPRMFEKIYTAIQGNVDKAPPARRMLARWALGVGDRVARARRGGGEPGLMHGLMFPLATRLVLQPMREKVFGPDLRFLVSGGAPLPVDIGVFFASMGVEILEGYGLTETTAATHVNRPGDARPGFVGLPLRGVETRIADDGEILLRGPVIMKGYYENPAANESSFEDGWFRTGDIGEISSDGALRITDRKKELIVTSAGKNIAPQRIEGKLKASSLVSQAMVYGDRRNFLVALIALNETEVRARLQRDGASPAPGPLTSETRVRELIQRVIEEANADLARYETVKKFVLAGEDFTPENGLLTPTLKLKRRAILAKYQHDLDRLYEND